MNQMIITNDDREYAVNDDQLLFMTWKATGMTIGAFIRANRKMIDRRIRDIIENEPVMILR